LRNEIGLSDDGRIPDFIRERVELYEEPGGRLVLHRRGSPLAHRLAEPVDGHFAQHADRLATGGEPPRGSEPVGVSSASGELVPVPPAELVAMCWEDGRIGWLRRAGAEVEPGWRARRYLAPPRSPDGEGTI
jgi:hypothetical protein